MKKFMFALMTALVICGCSSDDKEQQKETVSDITSDYLCSTLYWIKEDVEKPDRTTYMFVRIYNDYTGVKYADFSDIKDKDGKKFTFEINAPYINISFSDGGTEKLKVYAIEKEGDNVKHISINGNPYRALGSGVDLK